MTAFLIVCFATSLSLMLKIQLSDTTAQSLVTFFSVVFGFYMTTISILYNTTYTTRLHQHVDYKEQRRGTYILKSYLSTSGHWSILSISSVILFIMFSTKDSEGLLIIFTGQVKLLFWQIDLNIIMSSVLFGS